MTPDLHFRTWSDLQHTKKLCFEDLGLTLIHLILRDVHRAAFYVTLT
jgi:hypothetical protein